MTKKQKQDKKELDLMMAIAEDLSRARAIAKKVFGEAAVTAELTQRIYALLPDNDDEEADEAFAEMLGRAAEVACTVHETDKPAPADVVWVLEEYEGLLNEAEGIDDEDDD